MPTPTVNLKPWSVKCSACGGSGKVATGGRAAHCAPCRGQGWIMRCRLCGARALNLSDTDYVLDGRVMGCARCACPTCGAARPMHSGETFDPLCRECAGEPGYVDSIIRTVCGEAA